MFERLEDIRRKYDEVKARLADPAFVQDHRAVRDAQKALTEFEPIVEKIEEHQQVESASSRARRELTRVASRRATSSTRWRRPSRATLTVRSSTAIEEELQVLLLPAGPERLAATSSSRSAPAPAATRPRSSPASSSACTSATPRAAAGRSRSIDRDDTGLGGVKAVTAIVEGDGAYSRLKYEGGVHRVQRVPADRGLRTDPHLGRDRRRPARGRGRRRRGRRQGHPRRPLLRVRARAARASTRPTRPCA